MKLYQPQKDGTFKPTSVVVDDKLPETAGGQLAYAGAPDEQHTLWASIAEKAYAKLNNGYAVLDLGVTETLDALAKEGIATSRVTPPDLAQPLFATVSRKGLTVGIAAATWGPTRCRSHASLGVWLRPCPGSRR